MRSRSRFRGFLAAVGLLAVSPAAPGFRADLAAQQTHAVIVVGLGGSQEYRDEFLEMGVALKRALIDHQGVPADHVTLLTEQPDRDPAVDGRSTRAEILKVLAELSPRAAPEDRVAVVLIGHGTSQGGAVQFNLPGPDLGPDDFAAGLFAFPTQTLAFVHTGSAGGGFVAPLSGPRRVIVSATRTAMERNATEFPRFFVEALSGNAADLDKDGRTSLLEAFEYANLETARFYDSEGELLTEHAVLDDDGDGEGSRQPVRGGADGGLAATFHFGSGAAASATTEIPFTPDPELTRLYRERAAVQERLDALRARKASLSEGVYEEELEALLVELALVTRQIRERDAGAR